MHRYNTIEELLSVSFKTLKEDYDRLLQNPNAEQWCAAAKHYVKILRNYKQVDLTEIAFSKLVDYFKQLMAVERWAETISLTIRMDDGKDIDIDKLLLSFLQEKHAAAALRKTVLMCLHDYANYLAHVDGRLEQQRSLYQRLYENYLKQDLHDIHFEYECIYRIAQSYEAQKQYRLSAFYFAYALKLAKEVDDRAMIDATQMALIQQETYFLYHILCDKTLLESRCHKAIRSGDLNSCFTLYDELCSLGNHFWLWGDFKTAEACYEHLRNLLDNPEHPISTEGKNYQFEFLQAITNIQAEFPNKNNASDLKLTQLQQRRQTLTDERDRAVRNLTTQPIQLVQAQWSQGLKSFIAGLCKETETQLGVAPCQSWAILCLGSLARDEACLYSDFEFAIVWDKVSPYAREDDVDLYFRRFVSLLEIKVILLGETNKIANFPQQPITLAGMTAGLKFDDGRNYPFSGDKIYCSAVESYIRFLKPSNAKFQNKSLEACALEIDGNVKDALDIYMLADAGCLYGDNALVTDFKEKMQTLFADEQQIQSPFRYHEILAYRLVPNAGFDLEITDKINIKEQLISLPQRIVASLALFYGLTELSTDKRTTALVSKKIIHPHFGHLLQLALRLGFALRNQAHSFYHSENEDFYFGELEERFSETQAPFAATTQLLLNTVYPGLFELFQSWKMSLNQTTTATLLQDMAQVQKTTTLLERLLHQLVWNTQIRPANKKISAEQISQIISMGLYFMRDVLQHYEERKTALTAVIIKKSISIIEHNLERIEVGSTVLQLKEKLVVPLLHLEEDETFEQGFIKTLQTKPKAAERIITNWVELLLMLKLEEQHFMDWYVFLFHQTDEQRLNWCELFYRVCLRVSALEDVCLDMLELADSKGLRLLELIHEQGLNHTISTLASDDESKPEARKVTLYRANQPAMQLHPDVVKKLLDEKGHIIHNTGERAKEAYPYRRVHRLQDKDRKIDIFFKEHPDFPIMAYGSYLLNMRLTGYVAALTELVMFKVEQKKYGRRSKKQFNVVTIGASNIGRTSLLLRITKGIFDYYTRATVFKEFVVDEVRDNNINYCFLLWDCSSTERAPEGIHSFSQYYKMADIIIVEFDPTQRDTLRNTYHGASYWINDIRKTLSSTPPIILLKTKSELPSGISDDEIQVFLKEYDISYYCSCSAKTGDGIDKLRQTLVSIAKKLMGLIEKKEDGSFFNFFNRTKSNQVDDERFTIGPEFYPVLISLAVPGKTLSEVLKANEYPHYSLSTQYLSDCFLTEQIKHHGDALAQNFVMAPLKTRSHQLVCVDLEQMFVSPAATVGAVLKTRKIQEVNIIACLPELQPGGLLFDKGLHPEVVARFANLDISKILNGWLEDLERREQGYLQLVNDDIARELNQQRGAKHPYFHRMVFPRGVLRKLAHDLWGIKVLATRALAEKRSLFPQEIVAHCSGKKIARDYFAPALSSLSPQQRLQRITGRTVSQSNSEYQKFYVGENKTLAELFSSDYSIQHAKLELKGLYFNDINTEGTALKVFQSPRSMTINLAGMSAEEQKLALARLFNSQRKNNKYQQLHIESCETLDDAALRNIIFSSERMLQSLTLKSNPKVTLVTIIQLTKRFALLTELVLHTLDITTISNGQSSLLFKSLRVLCISQCRELTALIIKALKLEHVEIKSNTKLITLIIEAPNMAFIAIEENSQLKKVSIKPKPPSKLSLINVPAKCELLPDKNLYLDALLTYAKECKERQADEIIKKIVRTIRIHNLHYLGEDILNDLGAYPFIKSSTIPDFDYMFKILLLGVSESGLSSLMLRYSDSSFAENGAPTIGIDFIIRIIKLFKSNIELQIWDTNTIERDSPIYQGAYGIIRAFAFDDKEAFNQIKFRLCNNILQHGAEITPPSLLIGTRCDLVDKRQVTYEEGQALAAELGCHYIETSAKDDINISETFQFLTECIYHKFVLGNDEPLPLPDYIKRPPYYPVPSQARLLTQFSSVVSAPKPVVVDGLSKQSEDKPNGENFSLTPRH